MVEDSPPINWKQSTIYVKFNIGKNGESLLCRMCEKKGETHVTSECRMSAKNEYKRRHDNLTKIIHWNIRGKYKLMGQKNGVNTNPKE